MCLSPARTGEEEEKEEEETVGPLFCFHPLRPLNWGGGKKAPFYLSLHICEFACLLLALSAGVCIL